MENAISAGTKEAKHNTAWQIQTTKPIKCFNNDSFVSPDPFSQNSVRRLLFYNQENNPFLSPPVLVAVIIPDLSSRSAITLNMLQGCDHPVFFLCCSWTCLYLYPNIHPSIHAWTCIQTACNDEVLVRQMKDKGAEGECCVCNFRDQILAITRCGPMISKVRSIFTAWVNMPESGDPVITVDGLHPSIYLVLLFFVCEGAGACNNL